MRGARALIPRLIPTPIPTRVSTLIPNLGVLLVVAVGGGIGSLVRYAVTRAFPDSPGAFPWGTFTVNVGGCLLLGAFLVLVLEVWRPGRYLHPMVAVGLIGGMTTFSTFVEQLRELGVAGAWGPAVAYAAASLVCGVAAVQAGATMTRLAVRTRTPPDPRQPRRRSR